MSLAGPAWADLLGVRVGAAMWLVQPVYVLAEAGPYPAQRVNRWGSAGDDPSWSSQTRWV